MKKSSDGRKERRGVKKEWAEQCKERRDAGKKPKVAKVMH